MYTGRNHGICSYPHIIINDDTRCIDSLLVNANVWIVKTMIECRHRDSLCKIDMTAYTHWPYHSGMKTNAAMLTYHHIAYSIINTCS